MIRVYRRACQYTTFKRCFDLALSKSISVYLHARIYAPNPSNSRTLQYIWSLIVSCRSIITSVWHDSVLPQNLWARHCCSHAMYSSIQLGRLYQILLHVIAYVDWWRGASKFSHFVLFTWLHDICITLYWWCHRSNIFWHVECSWKIWSWHVYTIMATSHLYQITLMMSPRNMPWHIVTCGGMSLMNLWLSLNLIKLSTLAKLQNVAFLLY